MKSLDKQLGKEDALSGHMEAKEEMLKMFSSPENVKDIIRCSIDYIREAIEEKIKQANTL